MKSRTEARTSIRRRLLALLIVPVAIALLVGTVADLVTSVGPIREAYDHALSDAALALALNLQVEADGQIKANVPAEALNVLRTDIADTVYYRITAPDGSLLAGDPELPQAVGAGPNPRHQTAEYQGHAIRSATYRATTLAGTVCVTVAETLNKRGQIRSRLWSTALWTDLLQLLSVLGCVWVGVRIALRPLQSLGVAIAQRSVEDLSPLQGGTVPVEVQNVVKKLNELLATLSESRQAERQFLESAAHQLRTPLAGVLAQLELMVEAEEDAEKRQHLSLTLAAAQQLSHTTRQLLSLARAEHRAHTYSETRLVDLAEIAGSSVADGVNRASAAGVDLGADLQPAVVSGVAWLLSEALGNLIENAITYTPAGGAVTVRTGSEGGHAFLEVVDAGTGIAAAERDAVLRRFYRGVNSRGIGSGLGLAIVADVARQHRATLTIRAVPQGPGTCVRLDFLAESHA